MSEQPTMDRMIMELAINTAKDEGYAQGQTDMLQQAIELQCKVCAGKRPGYDPTPYLDIEGIWCHKSIGLAEQQWWPCASNNLHDLKAKEQP